MPTTSSDLGLAAPLADDLLRLYPASGSLFASPRRSMLTLGRHASVPNGPVATLAARAQALLDQVQAERAVRPLLLGAIPFSPDAEANLFVPEGAVFGEGVAGQSPKAQAVPAVRREASVNAVPSPQRYRDNVTSALARIGDGGLEKVVLSRSLRIQADVAVPALLRRLATRNPHGYTFAVELSEPGQERRTLVGASPELLLSRQGLKVVSKPLAGSTPRSTDPAEDARRADSLFNSEKDRREHQVVVEAVAQALRPFCRQVRVPDAPSLVSTPSMWHLATEISGDLIDPSTSSLQLALALHPTPAVCGHPTAEARAFIESVEGFDRGFFTGLVGWCDASGDGEWAVTIRCAELSDHSATLYAGAGIVAGSVPSMELAETSAKLRTMLNAMELESVLDTLVEGVA